MRARGGSDIVMKKTRMLWAGPLVALAILGAGCSSGGKSAAPEATASSAAGSGPAPPASSPTPLPMFTSSGDPVIDAYVHFWYGFVDAQALYQPDTPDLTRNGTGQALAWAQEAVRAYENNDWRRHLKSGYGIDPHVTNRSGDTVQIADVQNWDLWPLQIGETGQIVPNSTGRQCITAGLTRHNGAWLVSTLQFAQSGC